MLQKSQQRRAVGFTIVELLIVIVVIAILASISLVAYNGVQTNAQNSTRNVEYRLWLKQFEMYKVINGIYPSVPDGGHCLGSGFPNGAGGVPRCRELFGSQSYLESNNTALMTALRTVGSLPGAQRKDINTLVGPYVIYQPFIIEVYMVLQGGNDVCPDNAPSVYSDGIQAICRTELVR